MKILSIQERKEILARKDVLGFGPSPRPFRKMNGLQWDGKKVTILGIHNRKDIEKEVKRIRRQGNTVLFVYPPMGSDDRYRILVERTFREDYSI